MTLLRQLLLVPLLTPLLAVVLIGSINPSPALRLRLLTWQTPSLPLGAWLVLAAGGGSLLSALGSGLALRTGRSPDLRRQLRRPAREEREGWQGGDAKSDPVWPDDSWAAPPRPAGDPSPTVAVPYRVIRRGQASAAAASGEAVRGATVGDGWGEPDAEEW